MFTKRFFYVCAGLLCLALVYHLGASSATAQKATTLEVAAAYWSSTVQTAAFGPIAGNLVVMTNGDLYFNNAAYAAGWVKVGNALTP